MGLSTKTINRRWRTMHKARCVVRGDLQSPGVYFGPGNLYAPVASHEAIRIIHAIAAAFGQLVEGGYVSNAYLYGKMDVSMIIDQLTDSSGTKERPMYAYLLLKSMYGTKQARNIWGSLLVTTLTTWGFQQSNIEPRVFIKCSGQEFVIIVIVVDDMKFVSNSKAF